MALTKNTINGVGALTLGAALLVGGLFVAKPQYTAAGEVRAEATKISNSQASQELLLTRLKKEEANIKTHESKLNELKLEIPSSEEIDGIARVVVHQLGGVELTSFEHYPMMPFVELPAPEVSLETPEPPTSKLPEASATATGTPEGPPVLQTVPISITITAKNNEEVVAYMDRLASGPRDILVQSVDTSPVSGEDDATLVSATIYAYAFTNSPEVKVKPVAPKPEE